MERNSNCGIGRVYMPKEEYGGYLPLEIRGGKEWFHEAETDIRRYNCARAAIYAAAQSMKPDVKKIYLPYYICNSVTCAIEQAGIETKRFCLDENLEPEKGIPLGEPDIGVLVVNYFGIKDDFIKQISSTHHQMILDCTQAFFFTPIMRHGIRNIYSCRKFIGVPEGAYLIEKNTCATQPETGVSWEYYSFLCKAHEMGTNFAYHDSLDNEKRLGEHYNGMSLLTQRFLQGVDYDYIAKKRRENFRKLHEMLRGINRFDLSDCNGVSQCYPLWLTRNIGQQIKDDLLKKRIYIPTLWKECREMCCNTSLEIEWTNNLLCIPIDQRYSIWDMEYLAQVIMQSVEG